MKTPWESGWRVSIIIALQTLVVITALTACGSPANAPMATSPLPTPTASGTIAFERSTTTTNGDIYLVNADGSGLKQLTQAPGLEDCPSWSPDGRRIAFSAVEKGTGWADASVWIMNGDGSGSLQLTKGESGADPSWSPDGEQIAFVTRSDHGWTIAVMNADGTNLQRVTDGSKDDLSPSWAPDGRIVFFRHADSNVYAVNPDGSGLVPLTKNGKLRDYALSPDGMQLAVQRGARVEVIPVEGGGTPVTLLERVNDFMTDGNAALAWTPNGANVAMASNPNASRLLGSRIYIVDSNGSGLSAVPGIDDAMAPAWRPE